MAKSAWLQEVEDDARRITQKRIDDQKAEKAYQEEKARSGAPVKAVESREPEAVEADEPTVKKGK